MAPKVEMHCTVVDGKSLSVPLNILGSVNSPCSKTVEPPQTVTSQQDFVVVVALLFYVHGKHLRSCRDGQLT